MGLKWKSDIRIFVLPGPSLMRPFTCNNGKQPAALAAWRTFLVALAACNAVSTAVRLGPNRVASRSCRHIELCMAASHLRLAVLLGRLLLPLQVDVGALVAVQQQHARRLLGAIEQQAEGCTQ